MKPTELCGYLQFHIETNSDALVDKQREPKSLISASYS
jgi:hypothetical protein